MSSGQYCPVTPATLLQAQPHAALVRDLASGEDFATVLGYSLFPSCSRVINVKLLSLRIPSLSIRFRLGGKAKQHSGLPNPDLTLVTQHVHGPGIQDRAQLLFTSNSLYKM